MCPRFILAMLCVALAPFFMRIRRCIDSDFTRFVLGERRKRLTPALTQAFLEDLDRLPVDVDLLAKTVLPELAARRKVVEATDNSLMDVDEA